MSGGRAAPQRGLALVAVLWMVGALSLLVAGLLSVSRAEVRSAQTELAVARTATLGDAAIQLAVLDLRTDGQPRAALQMRAYEVDGVPLAVLVQPGSGFVDLNAAPEELLADLLQYAGGLDPADAHMLAQRIIDWRDTDEAALAQGAEADDYAAAGVPYRPRNGRFVVVEDLLQVLGFDFDLFDRIRSFVTVWSAGGQGVDPMAASEAMLAVLAGGDHALAAAIAARRDAGDPAIDTTQLNHVGASSPAASVLRLEARLQQPDGSVGRRARWVALDADDDGSPWITLAIEPAWLAR